MKTLFLQLTMPGMVLGVILLGTCLASIWYIQQLQANLVRVLSRNVAHQEAAQELEIRVRQLRFHSLLYLVDTKPDRLEPIEEDHKRFEEALRQVRGQASSPDEKTCIASIEEGYRRYHHELAQLRTQVATGAVTGNIGKWYDSHPIRFVVEPCQELLHLNKEMTRQTAQESERMAEQGLWAMLLLGGLGPVGGLVIGYAVAKGVSRSIYRLSVRVQDMARHLDQKVASVSVVADGDLQGLDRQLQEVVQRVEEVGERLQRHQREMIRAEQLSAVGHLAAGVAHEVRNPLTGIKLLVEAALRPSDDQPLSKDDLAFIHREIGRLEQRVQGFLDFARLPTPRRSMCDLHEVIGQALELVRARARQVNVEIRAHAGQAEPAPAYIDPDQVRTVFINLFLNALDAMPQGGVLEVVVEPKPHDGYEITVTDSGPGIAKDLLPRLFTPFVSSKPTGTGLGLSVSRRILEEHEGTIVAENRPEGGACFRIVLPKQQKQAARVVLS